MKSSALEHAYILPNPSALQPHDTGIAHGGCNLLGESGQTFLIPWDDFFNIELVADASTYL
jgi:hypothetical protein